MDRSTEATESPEDSSSRMFLNSLDFPPLTVPSRQALNITSSRTSLSNTTMLVSGSKKRLMKNEDEEISDEDSLSGSQNSRSAISLNSELSPVKKSRRLEYREPPPVLQSLDSDTFKTLLESPALSDSQNSEVGLYSLSRQSPRSSTNNFFGENLGSLGDIIQKYNYTTLDSLKGIEVLDSAISPTCSLDPPDLKQTEDTGIVKDLSLSVDAAVELPANILSCNVAADSPAPANLSHGESDHGVRGASQNRRLTHFKSIAKDGNRRSDVSNKVITHFKSIAKDGNRRSDVSNKVITHFKSIAKDGNRRSDVSNKESNRTQNNSHDDDYISGDETTEEGQHATNELLESDLEHYKKCRKRKNHAKFYSIPDLQVKDLPDEIRHEDTVTFLSCLSQLVVQITVHSTSAARKSHDIYSSYIGTTKKRYGSGFVASVDEDIRRYKCKREGCPHATFFEDFNSSLDDSTSMAPPNLNRSESCASATYNRSVSNMSTASYSSNSSSGSPGLKHVYYSGVTVHTNKHVIFDKSEADSAYVKFFYNTPEGREVIHGHVAAITGVNNNQDHVILHVMSHERAVFNTIGLCLHNARLSYNQMVQSISNIQHPIDHKNKHDWVAIISHPHGMSKAVSFGRIIREVAENIRIIKYYDAATCPGSSGGLVITPSLLKLQWPGAVHSSTDRKTGYNVTYDSRSRDLDPNDTDRIHKTMSSKKQASPDNIFQL